MAFATFFITTHLILGQIQPKLEDTQSLSRENDKIIGAFVDEANDDFVRLFENDIGSKQIEKGHYKGVRVFDKSSGLILSNGTRIPFENNEKFIQYNNGRILISKDDYENYQKEIKLYSFRGNSLSEISSMVSPLLEISVSFLKNGMIVLSDENEGFGKNVKIFSNNLTELNEYQPFDTGFERSKLTVKDDQLVGFFNQFNGENTKLTWFDGLSGDLVKEVNVDLKNFRCTQIHALGNDIILYGTRTLVSVGPSGIVNWTKEILLPNFELFHNNQDLIFAFDGDKIHCIKAQSGAVIWAKSITNFGNYGIVGRDKTLRIFSFENFDNSIGIVAGISKKGTVNYSDQKSSSRFYQIDLAGELQTVIDLKTESQIVHIQKSDSGFKLIDDNEIKLYEN